MNHVRKLALHGMRGRRKDTRVLALVIGMSFLFLTAGTLLLSSFSGSQARQRQSLYGSWHLLYGGGDSSVAESLTGLSQVAETAEVTLLGVDGQCGQVAAWSEDFARMGSLQIVEGRAPEAAGEILLERGQLGLFPEETGVGSTVTLTLEHHLTQLRGRQLPSGTMTIRGEEVPAKTVIRAFGDGATEASIQAIMERLWREEVWSTFSTYIDENGEEQRELWFPDTATHCPVSEMDDETYRSTLLAVCNCWGAALNDYYKYQLGTGRDALVEVDRTFFDSGVQGAVSWGLNTNYEQLYAKGVELDEAELQQMILDRGAVPAQDLTLTRTCTVVGIVETVSDRWDVGDTALPNCYLSEATAGELRDTLSYLETKDAPRLYRLPEEQKLLFLRGSGTVAGLYGQVLETELPRVREISENQYYRLLENEWGLAGYGHEATEWDLNLAREQWAEEQAKDPSLAGISLVDLEVDSSRYGGVWMEKENLLGSSYRREVYFHVPVFRWEMSDGSTRLEEGQTAYLMLPQYSSDSASVVSAYYSAREVPYQELLDGTAQVDSGEGIYASASWELPDLTEGYTYNQGQVLLNRYGYPREGGADRDHGGGHDRRDRHHHGVCSVSDFLHPAPAQGQAADPAQKRGSYQRADVGAPCLGVRLHNPGEPDFGGRLRRGCGLGGDGSAGGGFPLPELAFGAGRSGLRPPGGGVWYADAQPPGYEGPPGGADGGAQGPPRESEAHEAPDLAAAAGQRPGGQSRQDGGHGGAVHLPGHHGADLRIPGQRRL